MRDGMEVTVKISELLQRESLSWRCRTDFPILHNKFIWGIMKERGSAEMRKDENKRFIE